MGLRKDLVGVSAVASGGSCRSDCYGGGGRDLAWYVSELGIKKMCAANVKTLDNLGKRLSNLGEKGWACHKQPF